MHHIQWVVSDLRDSLARILYTLFYLKILSFFQMLNSHTVLKIWSFTIRNASNYLCNHFVLSLKPWVSVNVFDDLNAFVSLREWLSISYNIFYSATKQIVGQQ